MKILKLFFVILLLEIQFHVHFFFNLIIGITYLKPRIGQLLQLHKFKENKKGHLNFILVGLSQINSAVKLTRDKTDHTMSACLFKTISKHLLNNP